MLTPCLGITNPQSLHPIRAEPMECDTDDKNVQNKCDNKCDCAQNSVAKKCNQCVKLFFTSYGMCVCYRQCWTMNRIMIGSNLTNTHTQGMQCFSYQNEIQFSL